MELLNSKNCSRKILGDIMWKDALKKRKTHLGRGSGGMTPEELKEAKEKLRRKQRRKIPLSELKERENNPTFRAKQERARRSITDEERARMSVKDEKK
tara:strand:+ start:737 stop:1030 length:294 start_codon:yes stop_codon:yes gene_type:complete